MSEPLRRVRARRGGFRPGGPGRRGFSMIELILAAVLGVLVLAACWGLMSVTRASEKRSQLRADGLRELAQMHETLSRVFRTLVMLDRDRTPRARAGGAAGAAGGAGAGAGGAAERVGAGA